VILALIDEAVASGARLAAACDMLGLSERCLERWRRQPEAGDDLRAGPISTPAHALTNEERAQMVALATSPEYRNISVRQLVPSLADKGLFIASESSFYRVLHEEDLMAHRSHARPASHSKPKTHVATGPCQVWAWDITYLPAGTRGMFYYLYLVLDIWSRKIVAWEVHEEESMDLAADLAQRACVTHAIKPGSLVLHADNGGPMKGATMLATLQRLGIAASFSRPRVSDDNAACEALFRTLKYRPGYPRKPFANVSAARQCVETFVTWYNDEHLHSALRYVTPSARHGQRDAAILQNRHRVYVAARDNTPRRWTGDTRNWTPVGDVTLNPPRSHQAA